MDIDIKQVIKDCGGARAVAEACKSEHPERGHISTVAVYKWKRVPAEHCITVCRLSGGKYTPEDLRYDVFSIRDSKAA